ncbi:MAG TPA: acetate/propionate family kinase, partial [Usitatibacter sp.]|nr:acetate/propionate family kinase [Usitatibacter sp.]
MSAHDGAIVVFNAGSSSLKFGLYRSGPAGELLAEARGEIESLAEHPRLFARDPQGRVLADRRWEAGADIGLERLLQALVEWTEEHLRGQRLVAAGHRVALGGLEHTEPARVDGPLIERLRSLVPFAPLHLPANLEPIEILARRHPGLAQVACFDTAFHRTMPRVASIYALPRALTEAGARRFGFHGLSYEFIAQALRKAAPQAAAGRCVVAHLGSGASLCAMVDGESVATSMGFSPLSGIPMATRPGDVDPGILLWLLEARGMDAKRIESMLYRECGLAGVSGMGGDVRTLLASDVPAAREAIELFVYRIAREVASLVAAAGGLDALVFTAGVGENAPGIRAAVCRQLAWLGLTL